MTENIQARTAAARGFVRSLNILLKFARMYEFGHPRTARQYETAWTELRTALGSDDEAGLLLAVSGDQLLVDGMPLESGPSEKSFAQMLSAAGISSIHFSPKVTQSSLARLVRGFPVGSSSKPAQLAEQMKAALEGDPNIHVNEVCFVPADSAVVKTTVAAQIAARTLGMNAEQTDALLNDPEKLLQLIVAAEGSRARGGTGDGSGGWDDDRSGGQSGIGRGFPYAGVSGGRDGTSGSGWSRQPIAPEGGAGTGPMASEGLRAAHGHAKPSGANPETKAGDAADSGSGAYSGHSLLNSLGAPETGWPGVPAGESTVQGPVTPVRETGWKIVNRSGREGRSVEPGSGGFWLHDKDTGPRDGQGSESAAFSGTSEVAPSRLTAGRRKAVGGIAGALLAAALPDSHVYAPEAGGVPSEAAGQIDADAPPPSRWVHSSAGIRSRRSARAGRGGSMAVETGLMTLQQDELHGILQVLAQIARTSESEVGTIDQAAFQSRLSTLPRRARFTVSQALSALAAQAPSQEPDRPALLKLAEHIAVRFALESFERGDVKVNAVGQVLDEMNLELEALRKLVGDYETKLSKAGVSVQPAGEALAREFWSRVPAEKREGVLASHDAWCVPAVQAREYIEKIVKEGKAEEAERVLRNYASCVGGQSPEARKQTALGLAELAPMYAESGEKLLADTLRDVGLQLAEEKNAELQSALGAAFVRLSQEAARKRSYGAMQRSVEMVEYVENERPGSGKSLRPRIAVEDRLPEFIDESIRAGDVPNGLKDLLRRLPIPSAEHIAARFGRAGLRQDCDLLASMMDLLGPEGLQHLREQLRDGEASEAIDAVGILARMDAGELERLLPERMREWKRAAHDRVVRQIASSGAAERGRLLLVLFDSLEPLIRPLAIDEIGMAGEKLAEMRFLRIAEGDIPRGSTEYLRLKAIEALGRLRTSGSETILRRIAEARKAWRWAYPSELRMVSAQAMEKIDPEWVSDFLPHSGLNAAELSIEILDNDPESPAIRQRRYPRLRLEKPVSAVTTNLKENCQLEIPEMALGGGVALCHQNLHPGSVVELRMNGALNPVRAQSIVRDANTQARAFEVVEIDLDERAKLRKLLVQSGNVQKPSRPEERSHRSTRAIIVES